MIESNKRVPNQESAGASEQKPLLIDILGEANFSIKQRLAIEIIDSLSLEAEEKRLLFFCHLWHESGSLTSIKKFTGITSNTEIRKMRGKVLESDKLVEQYNNFYKQYKEEDLNRK